LKGFYIYELIEVALNAQGDRRLYILDRRVRIKRNIFCRAFESLVAESCGLRVHIQGIRVKFVYEGHRVKVKVTAAKGAKIPIPAM